MKNFQLIHLQPLANDTDLPFSDPRGKETGDNSRQSPASKSVDDVKQTVGTLYLPTYLPGGITISEAYAFSTGLAQVAYSGAFGNYGARMRITQFSTSGHPMVKDGYYRYIEINGDPGYAVNGEWLVREDKAGELAVSWETGRTFELMFEASTHWWSLRFMHSGLNPSDVEPELVKVAQSLEVL